MRPLKALVLCKRIFVVSKRVTSSRNVKNETDIKKNFRATFD